MGCTVNGVHSIWVYGADFDSNVVKHYFLGKRKSAPYMGAQSKYGHKVNMDTENWGHYRLLYFNYTTQITNNLS